MAAADTFLKCLEEKLATPEAHIWGEKLTITPGLVSFTTGQGSEVPVMVLDVFLVIGGAYQNGVDYKVIPSDTHKNAYEYAHRLGCYRLGHPNYRRLVETRLRNAVNDIFKDMPLKISPHLSLRDVGDSLELTCCLNGHTVPDWVMRIIPGIAGSGNPPDVRSPKKEFNSYEAETWLLVPPAKTQRSNHSIWEVARIPLDLSYLQRHPELYHACLCILYESEQQQWSTSRSPNIARILTAIAPTLIQQELRIPSSLQENIQCLLQELKDRLSRKDVAEYQHPEQNLLIGVTNEEIERVIRGIDELLHRKDFSRYVQQIEENIRVGQDKAINTNMREVNCTKTSVTDSTCLMEQKVISSSDASPTALDRSFLELQETLIGFKEELPIRKEDIEEVCQTAEEADEANNNKVTKNGNFIPIANGGSSKANGNAKGYSNGHLLHSEGNNKEIHPRRSIWHCAGILSICLVAFAVVIVLLLTIFEETDVMTLMNFQLDKATTDVSPDDKHEL